MNSQPLSATAWLSGRAAFCIALTFVSATTLLAGTKTWDGRHDTSKIEVTVVYYVPSDREPLADWKQRASYYCRRLELFHKREFQDHSTLSMNLRQEPLVSKHTTAELRVGDGDAIFFRTLRETHERLRFGEERGDTYPILLVLSEINWRPLDDFYRLKPHDGKLVFEGNYNGSEHFPGAASGGARATYLADRGIGWGLVSADGWRVPYRGADCVVYHEGVGHTVGLPHPQPGNGSVMSLGQYKGWINESWLDKEQKSRMKWSPPEEEVETDREIELFTAFRALPQPRVPKPNEPVTLDLNWPEEAEVKSLTVRMQTELGGEWTEVPQEWDGPAPKSAKLGSFATAMPISYRVDAELVTGEKTELWGYLQVRDDPRTNPQPAERSIDLRIEKEAE